MNISPNFRTDSTHRRPNGTSDASRLRGPSRPDRQGSALLICIVAAATIAMATLAIARMSVSSAMIHSVRVGSDGRDGLWVTQQRQRWPDADVRLLQKIQLRYNNRP